MREKFNPLPPDKDGVNILRGLSNCPLPTEAESLKHIFEQLPADRDQLEELSNYLGQAFAAITLASAHCQSNLSKRPAVRMTDDQDLLRTHEEYKATLAKLRRLQADLAKTAEHAQTLAKKRWELAVQKYGLSPEKYSYQIDEESGIIHLVDLDCAKCNGRATVQQARQNVSAALVRFKKEEVPDDRPADSGETGVSE